MQWRKNNFQKSYNTNNIFTYLGKGFPNSHPCVFEMISTKVHELVQLLIPAILCCLGVYVSCISSIPFSHFSGKQILKLAVNNCGYLCGSNKSVFSLKMWAVFTLCSGIHHEMQTVDCCWLLLIRVVLRSCAASLNTWSFSRNRRRISALSFISIIL